jgi:hypothetical protein
VGTPPIRPILGWVSAGRAHASGKGSLAPPRDLPPDWLSSDIILLFKVKALGRENDASGLFTIYGSASWIRTTHILTFTGTIITTSHKGYKARISYMIIHATARLSTSNIIAMRILGLLHLGCLLTNNYAFCACAVGKA